MTAPAGAGADDGAKKPRRKLVRGANKIEAQVLPEFADAVNALSDLDLFLGEQVSLSPTGGSLPASTSNTKQKRSLTALVCSYFWPTRN